MNDQLDPQAMALTKAIRQVESGGNFKARSKDGSFGAYQFLKPTWDNTARKYGVNAEWEKATPQQQNEVAYKQIKEWKDKGHNVGEIASMWNAGAGRPQAYLQGVQGTNSSGVNYNVANYAKKVATLYQEYKGQSQPQVQQEPIEPVEPIEPTIPEQKQELQAQGQATSVREDRTEPTFGGKLLRGIIKPLASVATTVVPVARQIGSIAKGEGTPDYEDLYAPVKSKYLGDIYSPGAKGIVKVSQAKSLGDVAKGALQATTDIAGKGLEVASYAMGGGQVAQGLKTLPTVLNAAKTGAKIGATGGFGVGLQDAAEAPTFGKAVGEIAKSTAIGAVGGGVLGGAIPGIARLPGAVSNTTKNVAGSSNIMQRVLKIPKGKQIQFKKMAGETIGEYAEKRSIFDSPEKAVEKLWERFTNSRNQADEAFAKLQGNWKSKQLDTVLDELMERELSVSAPGVPSPDIDAVTKLFNKNKLQGLDMSEINTAKRLYEKNVKLGHMRDRVSSDKIARATNIDNSLREWQFKLADDLGFENLKDINRETRLARFLADELGKQLDGVGANNAFGLTDAILLSGGDFSNIGMLAAKKLFSLDSVRTGIAKSLSRVKPIGEIKAKIGETKFPRLKSPLPGQPKVKIESGSTIPVAPKGSKIDFTGKQGGVSQNSPSTKGIQLPKTELSQEKVPYIPKVSRETPKKSSTVQLMMTNKMRQELKDLEYTADEISNLKPQEARNIIDSGKSKVKSSDLSTVVKKAFNDAKDTLKTLKDKNVRERGSISLEAILPESKSVGNQGVSLAKNTTEDLVQQAKKYKSAEDFANKSPSYVIDELRNQGVRGAEQRMAFWEEATKGMDKTPVIDSLNPTGGLSVDYTPKARMTAKLADNITTLDKTMGKSPDEVITIYRGAPKNQKSIVGGDFVTTNYDIAKSYAGDGNVLSKKVKLSDVLDDIDEPLGEEYLYRPKSQYIPTVSRKNGIKSSDLSTGDNKVAYHGTQAKQIVGTPNATDGSMGKAFYVTDNKGKAEVFGKEKNVLNQVITNNKGKKVKQYARESGYYKTSNVFDINLDGLNIKEFKDSNEFFKYISNSSKKDIPDWFKLSGYDGAYIKDSGTYAIYSPEKIKMPKGNQGVSLTKNTTEDLIQQAKKYKSAEEFVKAHETTGNVGTSFSRSTIFEKYPDIYQKNRMNIKPNAADKYDFHLSPLTNENFKLSNFENAEGFYKKPKIMKDLDGNTFAYLTKPFEKLGKQEKWNLRKVYDSTSKSEKPVFITEDGGKTFFTAENEVIGTGKTKSQLTDIWNKTNKKVTLPKSKDLSTELVEEAKKYKSAEEFVKAKTNAYHGTDKVFEKFDLSKVGTTQKLDKYGMFFTSDKQTARNYSSLYPQKSKVNWTPQDKINAEKAIVMDAFIKDSDALTFSEVIDLYEKGKIKTKVKSEGFVRPSTYFDMNRDSIKEAMEVTGKDVFKITKEGETFYMVNNPDKMMSKSQLTDIWNKANKK